MIGVGSFCNNCILVRDAVECIAGDTVKYRNRNTGLLLSELGDKVGQEISAPLYRLRLAISRFWLDLRPHSLH